VKRLLSMMTGSVLLVVVGLTTARIAEAQQLLRELPPLLRAVSDEPGVLSLAEGRALSRRVSEIERTTGVKMIVLVVVTVVPESVDTYTQRLINHWKRSGRALDNGRFVFIVISKKDRVVRIVPGPKLAWLLNPLAGSKVREVVGSLLRKNQYYEALLKMVNDIEQLIADRKYTVRLETTHCIPVYRLSRGKDRA